MKKTKNTDSKEQQPCLICKTVVDEDDTYEAYRKTNDYSQGKYPAFAYPEEKDLIAHLINVHRLPKQLSQNFVIGTVLGKFLKDNPNFQLGIIPPSKTTT